MTPAQTELFDLAPADNTLFLACELPSVSKIPTLTFLPPVTPRNGKNSGQIYLEDNHED